MNCKTFRETDLKMKKIKMAITAPSRNTQFQHFGGYHFSIFYLTLFVFPFLVNAFRSK